MPAFRFRRQKRACGYSKQGAMLWTPPSPLRPHSMVSRLYCVLSHVGPSGPSSQRLCGGSDGADVHWHGWRLLHAVLRGFYQEGKLRAVPVSHHKSVTCPGLTLTLTPSCLVGVRPERQWALPVGADPGACQGRLRRARHRRHGQDARTYRHRYHTCNHPASSSAAVLDGTTWFYVCTLECSAGCRGGVV